jgi:hypothetical protein
VGPQSRYPLNLQGIWGGMRGTGSTHGRHQQWLQSFLSVNLNGGHHLENLSVDSRMILKWMLNNWGLRMLTGIFWHKIGTGFCEHGCELTSSIKCWEVLNSLHYFQLLKKGLCLCFVSVHEDSTYLLTYGVEPFLRSCQMCSHSGNSQQF